MKINKDSARSNNHWALEGYRQRMTTKEWKQILLNGDDVMFFEGRMRRLKGKNLGAGVIEVYKVPLKED